MMRLDHTMAPQSAWTWFVLGLVLSCFWTSPLMAETYQNARMGFSFDVPAGGVRCAPDPGEGPEHGISVWLDGQGGECGGQTARPFITVDGNYNAMFWASPEVALQKMCTGGNRVPSPQLQLPGLSSASCRVNLPDNGIGITVAVMAGHWPGPQTAEFSYPYMLYTIVLSTTPRRFERDLARLRAVVNSLRIFPPQ